MSHIASALRPWVLIVIVALALVVRPAAGALLDVSTDRAMPGWPKEWKGLFDDSKTDHPTFTGAEGTVTLLSLLKPFSGTDPITDVAVKEMKPTRNSPNVEEAATGEAMCLKFFSKHANFIRYLKFGKGQEDGYRNWYIMMEAAPNGKTLADFNNKVSHPDENLGSVGHLFLGMVTAINEMHSKGVAHRDLKLENVFVSCKEKEEHCFAKVGDMGLACQVETFPEREPDLPSCARARGEGTLIYRAPEIVSGEVEELSGEEKPLITTKSDVWAMGIILYELTFGQEPQALKDAQTGPRATWFLTVGPAIESFDIEEDKAFKDLGDEKLKKLFRGMFERSYTKRSSTEQLLKDTIALGKANNWAEATPK